MKLLLNLNQYDYKLFLDENVNSLIIGLKNFSSGYLKCYEYSDLNAIINEIHSNGKEVYLSINSIMNETKINELMEIIDYVAKLEVEGFIVSDWGVLQLFKERNMISKVVFNPITTITNKYSADISNKMGIDHVVVANELNLNDILEIASYTHGNIEILGQGYYQICNSKRPLLSNYFKNFKIKDTSLYYKIKEENRDYAYPIIEHEGEVLIYIDKERTVMPYIEKLKKEKIEFLRIDTMFLSIEEVKLHINSYASAIKSNKNIEAALRSIETTNSNFKCLDNISILKKGD